MVKKLICLAVLMCVAASSFAYLPEGTILSTDEIAALSDEKLKSTYIDVVVEIEAMKTFHTTSGFTPKEYTAFKKWLRYRIELIAEMQKREMTVPQVE